MIVRSQFSEVRQESVSKWWPKKWLFLIHEWINFQLPEQKTCSPLSSIFLIRSVQSCKLFSFERNFFVLKARFSIFLFFAASVSIIMKKITPCLKKLESHQLVASGFQFPSVSYNITQIKDWWHSLLSSYLSLLFLAAFVLPLRVLNIHICIQFMYISIKTIYLIFFSILSWSALNPFLELNSFK